VDAAITAAASATAAAADDAAAGRGAEHGFGKLMPERRAQPWDVGGAYAIRRMVHHLGQACPAVDADLAHK
jgi:hypothetical protein